MATTNISIRSKDTSGTTGTTTINYVNPEATSSQLQSLASAFNDLTTNEIVDVTRIDKQVLGSEATKLSRNLALYPDGSQTPATSISASSIDTSSSGGTALDISADGDFNASDVLISMNITSVANFWVSVAEASGSKFIGLCRDSTAVPTGSFTVSLPETDTYAADSVTITLT